VGAVGAVQFPFPGSGTSHWSTFTIAIQRPGAGRVGLLGGTPQHPDPPPEDIPPGATARIPLGRVFFVEVADQSIFTLEGAMADPEVPQSSLFRNHIVIPFAPDTPSTRKEFQAVHLGDVTLKVYDAAVPTSLRLSLPIVVTRPDRLGNAPNQFDALFVDAAHRTGVPPQILKGVASREAGPNLRPDAYRYEPIWDLQVMSEGKNLRVSELPYPLYRLATKADTRNAALGEGTNIKKPEDIAPRSRYFIVRDGMLRRISNDDQFVSALEIFQHNDSLFGLLDPSVPDQRWSDPKNAQPNIIGQIRDNPSLLDFTAQTPLAASYGIMQVLYTTAIRPLAWTGLKSSGECFRFPDQCNPSFLFDTDENRAAGGGSLNLASDYLSIKFSEVNPPDLAINPDFNNVNSLREAFRRTLGTYNLRGTYPLEVLNLADTFLPVRDGTIFE
jgi:hypothetical protein